MADSRARAGKTQDEPGTSFCATKTLKKKEAGHGMGLLKEPRSQPEGGPNGQS